MIIPAGTETEHFIWSGMSHDASVRAWLHDNLLSVPVAFRSHVKTRYSSHYESGGNVPANTFLRLAVDDCTGLRESLTPSAIAYRAMNHAMECQRIGKTLGLQAARDYAEKQGVIPADDLPRLSCPIWWNRQMVTTIERQIERAAVRLGVVSRQSQLYVSDEILNRLTSRKRRSALVLSQMVAVSDQGDELNMLDVLQKSIANPEVRRAELMVRLAGFEQYALKQGHQAKFFTVTCPSKFHATLSDGKPNKRYQPKVDIFGEEYENSPRAAQKYLTTIWARVRAAHARRKYTQCYGFRVAEPHHDGCPHWHIILFGEQKSLDAFDIILRNHAIKEDGDELRTDISARYKVEKIDYSKGSAVSYVAKYISKNIDGYQVGEDFEAEGRNDASAVTTAERVRAWASVWGIRQFQQIGGAPVGVWRELRRVDQKIEDSDKMELARVAADLSDWMAYQVVQGGAEAKRSDMPLRTFSEEFDLSTGEVNTNRYDEIVSIVKGLEESGVYQLRTRNKNWSIQFKQGFNFESLPGAAGQGGVADPWTCVNNCTQKLEGER